MFNRSVRQMVGITLISLPLLLSGGFYTSIGAEENPEVQEEEEVQKYQSVEFILVNGTNRNITEFYVSHPSEDNWGENILDAMLEPGDKAIVTINDGLPDCIYDLMAHFGEGEDVGEGAVYERDVSICDGTTYTYIN
jgi:hypothetical protein